MGYAYGASPQLTPITTPRGSKSGGANGTTIPWDVKLPLRTTPTATPRSSATRATPSAFYNNRMSNSPEVSNSAAKFRAGAEKVVLDREKQDKLANLVKAVQ